ncbi:AAA domain (dynein-related subfamily), putative [Angomonas deanei]|uniref:AAA domain (Dynein-related subfamily), putative n=1 Tax=Angomonas deanei TaxID=59799 RepID=A0A7G2CB55_9TRYP|nr:AAA domain (dynein-related subfamily), putative [Angomonas deanei]
MPGIDHTLGPLVEAAAANEESKQLGELALNQENPFFSLRDPLTRSHLRWMAQKEILGQDMCLIGDQGPAMRWLVQLYSFLTRREICTVNLNRDVTESDLKQRREIRNKTLVYEDQGAVTAAKRGQLLVLEGLEKVERNVLPVINNLLENREMHLDNGQILIHPARYDSLLRDIVGEKTTAAAQSGVEVDMNQLVEDGKKQLELMGLLRVSEKFKVIGITVPVPPYEGNPLDPPLRSRFQCLYVRTPLPALPSTSSLTLGSITTTVPKPTGGAKEMEARMNTVSKLRMSIEAVNSSTGDFRNSTTEAGEEAAESGGGGSSTPLQNVGNYELSRIARQLITFPDVAPGEVLYRGFPWHLYSRQMMNTDDQRRRFSEYAKILGKCQLSPPLLLAEEASKPSSASHSRSSSLSGVSRQASDALKAVMGGAPTSESIRSYLLSGQLVGGRTKVTTGMEQSCNYFRRFKNIRVATALSTCDDKVERTIVVADAEVGTATRGENGKDFFTLPVYMGSAAPALYGNGEVEIGSVCPSADSIFTTAHYHVLQTMLQCHATRQHMALIGPTGCGKTALVREFTKLLGYEKETTHLYADMTNKDFFQRRTTDAKTGNTTWENAALVEAAIHGKLVVLDGIDKLSFGMLASLQQLLVDQNANLFDGTVLKPAKEYEILKEKLEMSDAEMREKKIFPIHPAFRVIATARPPGEGVGGSQGKPFTISQDVTTLFSVITMPDASETTLEPVLLQVAERELQLIQEEGLPVPKSANTSKIIHSLLSLRTELESIRATDPKVPQLTFRQLLHLAKGAVRYPSGVSSSISSALLLPLMSGVSAAQVTHALESCGFSVAKKMQEESLVKSDAPGKAVAVYKVGDYPVLQVHRAYTTIGAGFGSVCHWILPQQGARDDHCLAWQAVRYEKQHSFDW